MHWLYETLWMNRQFNDTFTILLFWIPFAANAIAYTTRIYKRVQIDKAAVRGIKKYHNDWLRVGHLIGYFLATVLPLVNLTFFVFDTLGDIWAYLWEKFSTFFDFRLVRGTPPEDKV